MTFAQVESVYLEALQTGVPKVQVENVYLEALQAGVPKAQVESTYLEVLVTTAVPPSGFTGWGMAI